MRRPRLRFKVRGLMLAVVLVGLNLAAVRETSRFYPRPRLPMPIGYGNGRGAVFYGDDRITYYKGNAETGYSVTRVEFRPPRRPSLLRIWAPVAASVGISLMTLVLAWKLARRLKGGPRFARRDPTFLECR
jgi:hypothetical protein